MSIINLCGVHRGLSSLGTTQQNTFEKHWTKALKLT